MWTLVTYPHISPHLGLPLRRSAATISVRPLIDLIPPSEARSRNMAAIRSRDTRPELLVRQSVHSAGFRYRLHRTDLPGKPDLTFPRFRVAVFVHGCFWHGHICREARRPTTNLAYWSPKIERNMLRDRNSAKRLRRSGWKVVTIRECGLHSGLKRLVRTLNNTPRGFGNGRA